MRIVAVVDRSTAQRSGFWNNGVSSLPIGHCWNIPRLKGKDAMHLQIGLMYIVCLIEVSITALRKASMEIGACVDIARPNPPSVRVIVLSQVYRGKSHVGSGTV